MIKKLKITNVGRFISADTAGDTQFFKKHTYIYGKNTFGKSTLTAIFRSLKDNNPNVIIGRKTINSGDQLVIISDTANKDHRFLTTQGNWNNSREGMIIFDGQFVRENVYTQHQQIGSDQQKSIESFMLGTKGKEYNVKISALEAKISENTLIQGKITRDYTGSKHLLGDLPFDKFISVTQNTNVEADILVQTQELDKIKNTNLISSKLNEIRQIFTKFQDFNISQINTDLSVNSELISQHYETYINHSENKHTYSAFLQTGSKLRTRNENEHCPFCTQEILDGKVKTFLDTIDQIYNAKYAELNKSLKGAEALFAKEAFTKSIDTLKTDLQQGGYNIAHLTYTEFEDLITNCHTAISSKKGDLSSPLNTEPFEKLKSEAEDNITAIDQALLQFANPVDTKLAIEQKLKVLLAAKERYGSWKERCEEYAKAKAESKTLGTDKKVLWDEYLAYANGLSSTMLLDINKTLKASNCNFTVKNFKFQGNQRQDLLVLSLNGAQISNSGQEDEMTVKNCLSDSDKWILALAFFLSTVKNDPTVKTVIMDDPVSSFDVDRKRIILNLIKETLKDTDKQLILLTHEKGFFHLVHSESKADNDTVFLSLKLHATTGSDLLPCNPDEDAEFMNDYNCWISDMKLALTSYDLTEVKRAHSSLRPVIEHIIKIKYPLEIGKDQITLGKMLEKLEMPGGAYHSKSYRAEIDAILVNETHHDHSGATQYAVHQLGIEDFRKDITDTFDLIKVI